MELHLTRENIVVIRETLKHQIDQLQQACDKFPQIVDETKRIALQDALDALPEVDE